MINPHRVYGIMGYGTLGKALATNLTKRQVTYWTYDPKLSSSIRYFNKYKKVYEGLNDTEAVFICVPTPPCDDGYVIVHILDALDFLIESKYRGVVIIKSTIGANDFRQIKSETDKEHGRTHGLRLFVSPEFVREKSAAEDLFHSQTILYGPWTNKTLDEKVRLALISIRGYYYTYGWNFVRCDPDVCALMKTGRNFALAAKLAAANFVHLEGRNIGLSHNKAQQIVNFVFEDRRLKSEEHYHDVGNQNQTYGFAGKCLPKDLEAKMGSPDEVLRDYARGMFAFNQALNDEVKKRG